MSLSARGSVSGLPKSATTTSVPTGRATAFESLRTIARTGVPRLWSNFRTSRPVRPFAPVTRTISRQPLLLRADRDPQTRFCLIPESWRDYTEIANQKVGRRVTVLRDLDLAAFREHLRFCEQCVAP